MSTELIVMWYLVLGLITALINGAIRKLEADALLGLAWIMAWPLTYLGFIARGVIYCVKKF